MTEYPKHGANNGTLSPEGRDEGLRDYTVPRTPSWQPTAPGWRDASTPGLDEGLREQLIAAAWQDGRLTVTGHGHLPVIEATVDAVLAVVSPALAQRDRVIAAVTALCDKTDAYVTNLRAGRLDPDAIEVCRGIDVLVRELRAALASGDGRGEQ